MRKFSFIFPLVSSFIVNIAFLSILSSCGQRNAGNEMLKSAFLQATLDAYIKGDVKALDTYLAADFIQYCRPPEPDIKGLETYKNAIIAFRRGFQNLQVAIEPMIMDGNFSAWKGSWQATEISTGKHIKMTVFEMYRWENGKAVESWNYSDIFSLYQQLGYKMLPPLTPNTYAQLTITQKNPEKMAESVKIYGENVVPEIKKQKGFRGCLLLDDFKTGKSISIVLWEYEEDVRAVEQSGFYKTQIDKFKGMFTSLPVREGYMVTVQE